jgi:hypothetical protein
MSNGRKFFIIVFLANLRGVSHFSIVFCDYADEVVGCFNRAMESIARILIIQKLTVICSL